MWSLTLFPNLNTQSLLSMQIACESPCSSLFFCCYDKMPWQNQLRRGKGSLNWHFQGTVHQGRKEEWELKVRTLRQELKQRLWRSIDFSLLSWATQDHLPKDDLGLSPPTSTVNQKKKKNGPQTFPKFNLMEAMPHLRFPLSRMTLICIKLTKTR